MALKPLKPCKKPGCSALTRDGWCSEHRPRKAQRRESQEWHWLYGTSLWKDRLRPAQLVREPFCRECALRGFRVRATVVDHVVPHRGDMGLFSDPDNLESLCESCHNRKTAREMADRAKKGRYSARKT